MVDTIAHAVLSYIIFHKQPTPTVWLAVLFGVLPDLFSWTIFAFYNIFTRGRLGQPDLNKIPKWTHKLYKVTHSFFAIALIFIIIYLLSGKVPVYLWAWPLHVLIDIPTHSRKFLPTPFLWPFSDWKFPGISWGEKRFLVLYWMVLTLLLILTLLKII